MKNTLIALMMTTVVILIPIREVDSSSIIYKGVASWYSESDPGILETTANMEQFDDTALTCAIWDIPFNVTLKVTNLENGKVIYVRVNDRGPAKRLVAEGRIVDLTRTAFAMLDDLTKGLIKVSIEIL